MNEDDTGTGTGAGVGKAGEDRVARPLRAVGDNERNIDPWETDDGTYSEEKFYTRSVDSKGHKETLHVPLQPNVFGTIGYLVASRQIPEYRTPQDFVRDAIVHRLRAVQEMLKDGRIEKTVDYEMIHSTFENMLKEMEDLDRMVQEAERVLSIAEKSGDHSQLTEALDQAKRTALTIRDPYRTKVVKAIQRYDKEFQA